MKQTIIDLKQRIDKNHKRLQRKYPLTKIVLKKINELIDINASDKVVVKWLREHDNVIFTLEQNLKNLER